MPWVCGLGLVLPVSASSGGVGPVHRVAGRAGYLYGISAGIHHAGAGIGLEGWGYGFLGGRVGLQVGYLSFPGDMPEGTKAADQVAGAFSVGAVLRWNELPGLRAAWDVPLELRTSLDSRILAGEPLVGVAVTLGAGVLWSVAASLGLEFEIWGGWMKVLTHSTDAAPESSPAVGLSLGVAYLWH